MISLVRFITEYCSKLLGKRGELRNKDVLLAPKLSSSIRMSEFLSSRFLLFNKISIIFYLSIFVMYPHLSYSAIYFLPDAQSDEVLSSLPAASIDASRCEEIGYTYYSSSQCPAYHN